MTTNQPMTWEDAADAGYVNLLLGGNRGIYLPQNFAEGFDLQAWGLRGDDEDVQALLDGPDHEFYCEAWDAVTQNARHVDEDGNPWILYQDGDLWAVRADIEIE